MRIIDLSQPVYDGSPNCPVHPPVRSELIADHPDTGWRVELLTLSNHTGSHVDAPLHKLAGGASLDEMPLETFVGPAKVVDLRGIAPRTPIGPEHLGDANEDLILLLATGWGDKRAKTEEWHFQSPFLSAEGARFLVQKKVRAIGIDHFSIGGAKEPENGITHEILLSQGIWILEELHFPEEAFGLPDYPTLWSLPINLKGHSGAFCRPVLVVD